MNTPKEASVTTLNKRLLMSLGLPAETAGLVSDRIAELESSLGFMKSARDTWMRNYQELAETNGKALARAEAELELQKSYVKLAMGTIAELRADMRDDELAGAADLPDAVQAIREQLAQSQAREASLAAALGTAIDLNHVAERNQGEDWSESLRRCVTVWREYEASKAALARHQAAVDGGAK